MYSALPNKTYFCNKFFHIQNEFYSKFQVCIVLSRNVYVLLFKKRGR